MSDIIIHSLEKLSALFFRTAELTVLYKLNHRDTNVSSAPQYKQPAGLTSWSFHENKNIFGITVDEHSSKRAKSKRIDAQCS